MTERIYTAGLVVIGDEILSGRTHDKNIAQIASWLQVQGIRLSEVRVVPDVIERIVEAVNALRESYDYLFTTGGIGPTHDDITADAVAKAFGVGIDYHPEAVQILGDHYKETGGEFTKARMRMARMPEGATMIANPLSKAPGFQIGNVFVMAGVPMVMQVMLDSLTDRLEGGAAMQSRTVTGQIGEGTIAEKLGDLQARHPEVGIGSYPYYRGKVFGTSIVVRATDSTELDAVADEVAALMREFGVEPAMGDPA